MVVLDPVSILEQRRDFLEGIIEVARLSNWSERAIEGLRDYLWEELVDIDNAMFDVYEKTGNKLPAYLTWEARMEDLRRWLSLIFGIKIQYV